MPPTASWNTTLRAWMRVPDEIEAAIRGASGRDLDAESEPGGMSIRETVHHIVEANLVAASMLIAARGKPGTTYDWTWLFPNREWTSRQEYARARVEPAIAALRALVQHFGALLRSPTAGGSGRIVLQDEPGGKPYTRSVQQIVQFEVEHAHEHLQEVAAARAARAARPVAARKKAASKSAPRARQTRSVPPKRSR